MFHNVKKVSHAAASCKNMDCDFDDNHQLIETSRPNSKNFLQTSQCCPVCDAPLGSYPNPKVVPITGTGRLAAQMRYEVREMQAGKCKESELVVAALCGHLYHRFCLRHYCFVYKQVHPGHSVDCPICSNSIDISKFHPIDYKPHLMKATNADRKSYECRVLKYTKQEIKEQKSKVAQNFDEIQQRVKEAKLKLDAYKIHQQRIVNKTIDAGNAIKEKESLLRAIDKCNNTIQAKYKDNVELVRIYLSVMKGQPQEFLRDSRIPPQLIPCLQSIIGDEKLLLKFGEVLQPMELNGVRSDSDHLVKEIMEELKRRGQQGSKLNADNNYSRIEEEKRKKDNEKSTKYKPVVVKVESSSVSIFARTELDDRSLRKGEGSVSAFKDANQKVNEIRGGCDPRKSVSDIKIIMEPRRKPAQHHLIHSPEDVPSFIKISELPVRRCKSTQAILMKNNKKKGVLRTIENLKIEPVSVGNCKGTGTLDKACGISSRKIPEPIQIIRHEVGRHSPWNKMISTAIQVGSNISNNIQQQRDQQQGILPGPYLPCAPGPSCMKSSRIYEDPCSLPVYQSKWLTKLPSVRNAFNIINIPSTSTTTNAEIAIPHEAQNLSEPNQEPMEEDEDDVCTNHTVITMPCSKTTIELPFDPVSRISSHYVAPRFESQLTDRCRAVDRNNNAFATIPRATSFNPSFVLPLLPPLPTPAPESGQSFLNMMLSRESGTFSSNFTFPMTNSSPKTNQDETRRDPVAAGLFVVPPNAVRRDSVFCFGGQGRGSANGFTQLSTITENPNKVIRSGRRHKKRA